MLYNVIKYSIVDDEIEKAILYYESASYNPGLRFESEVEKALDKMKQIPDIILTSKIKSISDYQLKGSRML